jgi:hypothetical protein
MRISRPLVLCFSLVSGTALANPIAYVARLSVEVTGSTHVRVRFTGNVSGPPDDLVTFGTSQSKWFTTGAGESEDTGSGVETMGYEFLCDCHVPTGSPLTYTSKSLSEYSPKMTVTVTPSANDTDLCDEECAVADKAANQDTSGSACSFSPNRRDGTLALLLVLGLVASTLRRRR